KVCGSARASKKTMTLTKGCAGALPRRGGEVTWIRSLRRFRRASAGGASSAVRRIKANAVSRDMGAGGYGIGHAPATPFRRTTLPAPLGQHGECDIVRKGPGLLVGLAERRRLWEAGLAETVRLYPVELAGRNVEDVVRTSPPGAVHIRSAGKASVRPAAALRDRRTCPPGAVHIRSAGKASVRPAAALRDRRTCTPGAVHIRSAG